MHEFYVTTASHAAPFCSDTGDVFVEAETARAALEKAVAEYKHPAGLFAAAVYTDANAERKNKPPLHMWLCNLEQEKRRLTKDLCAYSFCNHGGGVIEIDGVKHTVADHRNGSIVK